MRKNNVLRLFLFSLIVSSVPAACGPNWEEIAKQRDDITTLFGTENARMSDSKTEVKNRSGDFPAKYTQATESQLTAAQEALRNIGSNSTGWLGELNTAIEERDKRTAKDRLEKIQTALDQIRAYTNQILGPPEDPSQGLYDILDVKVTLLHDGYVKGDDTRDLLAETKDLDATTLVSIQAAVPFNLCGSQNLMSFKDARASYGSGVALIRSAEQLISEGDEPAASDALVDAMRQFNAASGSITITPTNHQLAVDAISAAEASKVLADMAYLFNTGDYIYTVASEISSGDTDLGNALIACQAEDFLSAVDYANSAKGHFDDAVYWSTEEEEEEVYIPPSDDGDDDPVDPWSYESEDTTPSDDPSWDYDYDDSDSWDYDYDDSDSWDYDYDDSSSWDDALFMKKEEIVKLIQPLIEWIQK